MRVGFGFRGARKKEKEKGVPRGATRTSSQIEALCFLWIHLSLLIGWFTIFVTST